jgi:hypothetical protein
MCGGDRLRLHDASSPLILQRPGRPVMPFKRCFALNFQTWICGHFFCIAVSLGRSGVTVYSVCIMESQSRSSGALKTIDPTLLTLPSSVVQPVGPFWPDIQSACKAIYDPQPWKRLSPKPPIRHHTIRYTDLPRNSVESVRSIDSGYHSVAIWDPEKDPTKIIGLLPDDQISFGGYKDGPQTLCIPLKAGENTTDREAFSAMTALPSIESLTSSPLNLDSTSHRVCVEGMIAEPVRTPVVGPTCNFTMVAKRLELDDPKERAQSSPRGTGKFIEQLEPTTSDDPKCAAISTTRSTSAQEDQTERPGYVKKWVDSTCVIQSLSSGYSGEEMTSSCSNFGIGYESFPAMSEPEEDGTDTDSESFVLTEYSENSPNWDPTGATLAPMKLEYIDRLLSLFNPVQRQWQSSVATEMAGLNRSTGSSSGKRRASSPPSGNSSESRPPKKTKRQSTNGDNGEGQDGDDDGENSQTTLPNVAENGQGTCLFFACPFVKRYPHRYHKCYSYTLKDVARVKYHLFRDKVHRLPIYCPTCSERFSLEDLRDEHVRASNCTMKPQVKWEGISANQREKLNKRSPSTNSAVENWNAVYRILFPGDPIPASPYIDMSLSGELRAFWEHALSTGPSVWNEILRTELPENLRSSLEELQSFHRSFYSEAIARLFETWDSSRSTTRSFQFQSSPSLIRQEPEYLAPPINTAAIDGSSSPSGSDSALGKSVTNGSQSENEPGPASQSEVALPAQTQQQQQSVRQRDPQASIFPQQLQTPPTFPHSIPQMPSFTSVGSADFTGHGFSQNLYEHAQVPTFTPNLSGRQMFNPQYTLGTFQPAPEFNQFQYQPPSVNFPQSAFHQPPPAEFPQGAFYPSHQTHFQPQHP